MQNNPVTTMFMWVAVALYLIGAVAWAGVDLAAYDAAHSEASAFSALIYNPNTWSFIGWEGIFILAGLTVRAAVIRLTE